MLSEILSQNADYRATMDELSTIFPLCVNYSFVQEHLSATLNKLKRELRGWHYIQNGVLANNQYTAGITAQDFSVRI